MGRIVLIRIMGSEIFFCGQKMWGYVLSTCVKPKNDKVINYIELLDTQESNNSKIITLINNYVVQSTCKQLAKYDTIKKI